jgi:azurin
MRPTASLPLTLTGVAVVALAFLPAPVAAQKPAGPRTIEIKASDAMKYDVTTIEAKPGEQLRIRLASVGTLPKVAMSHNIVVLKKGVDAKAFADKAITARDTAYVPPELKAQVVVASALIGNGEKTEITFKVPAVPGRYEYICTFPGHFASGMKGVLIVK